MIRQFFKRRRRGAMALVAVVGMMPVSAMLNANMNTSQIIEDRRHVQDAADAMAKTHGVWSARALNVISMNNVTSAQLLTVAVGSDALDATLVQLIVFAGVQELSILGHGAIECAPRFKFLPADLAWGGFCGLYHSLAAIPAANAIIKADDIYRQFDPIHGSKTAEKALAAIEGMNRALIARHPRAMREISADYAKFLGIDAHHFADPCGSPLAQNCRKTNSRDGMALPLEEGDIAESLEMCAAMRFGNQGLQTTFGARGFDFFKGPIRHGGSAQHPSVKDHINHVTEIGQTLEDYDRFYKSGLAHLPRHPLSVPRFTPAGNTNAVPRGRYAIPNFLVEPLRILRQVPVSFDPNPNLLQFPTRQQRDGDNAFKQWFEVKFASVCFGFANTPIVGLRAEVPTLWELPGVTPLSRITDRTPMDMDEAFRILAFAQKDQSQRLDMMIPYLNGQVTQGNAAPHTGYGQVGLFNPDGATLYSQSWRARLMPATRMDDAKQAANNLDRQATAAFDPLVSALRSVNDQSTWRRIHAH
ncbi:MAG: hypothetical protein AAFP98_12295 [Pseudomonadota bacterium]